MKGSYKRGSQLRSVRMTLSKLDAKYSKSSVIMDEEDSDFDDNELMKQTASPTSLAHLPEVESSGASKNSREQHKEIHSSDTSEQMRSKLKQLSASEQGSSQAEDSTSPDTASSIESVKTDSILGFNNVHSVSSLADSVLRSDEKERRMSISLSTVQKLQQSSSSSAGIDYESIISNKVKNEPVEDTSSSSLSLKQIERITQKSQNTIDSRQEMEPATEEKPLGIKRTSTSNITHDQVHGNSVDYTTTNYVWNVSDTEQKPRPKMACKSNKLLKLKRKSNAEQTNSLGCQEVDSSVTKNNSQGKISNTECSVNTQAIKATKLPLFLNDISATNKGGELGRGIRSESSGFIENELSELIAHHLHLTKEFLERQHRMYLANCKAVQFLEKGYQENMLHGERGLKVHSSKLYRTAVQCCFSK